MTIPAQPAALISLLGIFAAIIIFLLIRCIRNHLEMKSLCMQLDELAQGSHMEIFVCRRDKTSLELCKKLNEVVTRQHQKEIQYERSQKRLKQNISALAHDIRTPLTSAAGYLQMGADCADKETRDRYLDISSKRLKELKDMLEELFLYTKLSTDDFQLSTQDLQVLPLLSECLIGMYQQFEEKGVTPLVEFETEGFHLKADEDCLNRIFRNLIQNALQHGNGGITITQQGRQMTFSNPIADDTHLDVAQIFDRFYKADAARRRGSSGMGLAIVKELVEKMGGGISAAINDGCLQINIMWAKCCSPSKK